MPSQVSDRERFDALWGMHRDAVARFVGRRLPGHEDGADLVAEVFLTAWRRLDELPADPGAARPWLYGVARKTLANRFRGTRREQALRARLRSERAPEPVRGDNSPGAAALVAAFNELSPSDREAIALVTWEELTPTEAAAVLGITPARFRVRLHRARRRLRERAEMFTTTVGKPALGECRPEEA